MLKSLDVIHYLRTLLTKRLSDMEERGASAVEYGLLVAGIAAVIVTVVIVLGHKLRDSFNKTCNAVGSDDGGVGAGDAACTDPDAG
jgi:pilus assembly protein Flp/PilA